MTENRQKSGKGYNQLRIKEIKIRKNSDRIVFYVII